jgi:hypothetical protein
VKFFRAALNKINGLEVKSDSLLEYRSSTCEVLQGCPPPAILADEYRRYLKVIKFVIKSSITGISKLLNRWNKSNRSIPATSESRSASLRRHQKVLKLVVKFSIT